MRRKIQFIFSALVLLSLLLVTGCAKSTNIVNNIGEREANEIIVFLASKGILAAKVPSPTTGPAIGAAAEPMWSISVDEKQTIDAMAILNQNGLPRKKAVKLLDLFAKTGLVSSEREESIRFQAGLAAQIAGTIRKIDGVIDAVVEISIPAEETILPGMESKEQRRTRASVFVKHQGILDDPNSHLVTKIKRLVSGSISGLDINDVTVISDRSRFTDITLQELTEDITPDAKEYVSIWSIVMSKGSASRFRSLFFVLIFGMIAFALMVGWMFWKFYPILRKKGLKNLFHPIPFKSKDDEDQSS
ncbi:MAG: Nodulation protein NolT [Chlamydiae bacterium]|nr:Nodulation protein NolT [Chlamydiota bacterium]